MAIASVTALPECETVCATKFCRGRDQIEDTLKQGCVCVSESFVVFYVCIHAYVHMQRVCSKRFVAHWTSDIALSYLTLRWHIKTLRYVNYEAVKPF